MGIELREKTLVNRLVQLARQQGRGAEQVLEAAVREYLDRMEKEVIHQETDYFWSIHDELVAKYSGEYVAIHAGQIVDHDVNVRSLDARVRQRYGWLPVLIAPVRPEPQRDLYWRGARSDHSTSR